jgi:hypothetical protein
MELNYGSWDSSLGVVTMLWDLRLMNQVFINDRGKGFSFSPQISDFCGPPRLLYNGYSVLTTVIAPSTQTTYTMGTGGSPREYSGRDAKLTTQLHLVQRLSMREATPLSCVVMVWCLIKYRENII